MNSQSRNQCWTTSPYLLCSVVRTNLLVVRNRNRLPGGFPTTKEMKMKTAAVQPTKVVAYGSFLALILSKKSRPGDGIFGRGVKGG
ncbi:hypothetical protein SAMN05216551_102530 [Chitinasiproducens palmae]|uniref:Uncharacterized protein n=1 Tax=Chitinasiproducens palmae TaxID=1770053 RepID=A0A1H2PLP5_9BURK|nr:hypothetical protein SAMN05216551_102530 [Chitinasiproducens palmae]